MKQVENLTSIRLRTSNIPYKVAYYDAVLQIIRQCRHQDAVCIIKRIDPIDEVLLAHMVVVPRAKTSLRCIKDVALSALERLLDRALRRIGNIEKILLKINLLLRVECGTCVWRRIIIVTTMLSGGESCVVGGLMLLKWRISVSLTHGLTLELLIVPVGALCNVHHLLILKFEISIVHYPCVVDNVI